MATATVKTKDELLKEKYPAMATSLGASGVLLNATKKQGTIPSGVSEEAWKSTQQKFTASEAQNTLDSTAQSDLSKYRDVASKDKIINNVLWNEINSSFSVPSAVKEADRYLAQQLEKIQSGRTSYSDKVEAMMDKIANREEFSYDVDTDALFQQALASAMNSGKQAMQDTIGQASALTGGYGSTYATSAANQVYNDFIEDAYDNLPQYYKMAMDKYQMEGDELYRQLGMYNDADTKEYERMLTAYDATYAHRNQQYNEAYAQYRDEKSDAFAKANLKISEHGQLVTDAYNLYMASSSYADNQYQREYNSWLDSVNNAFKAVEIQRTDFWDKTNFYEDVRQFNETFKEDVRQFDETLKENVRQFDVGEANKLKMHADEMNLGYADIAAANARNAASIASAEKMQQLGFEHDTNMSNLNHQQNLEIIGIEHSNDLETIGMQQTFTSQENEKDRTFQSEENAKYNLTVDQQLGLKANTGGSSGGSGGGGGGGNKIKEPTETQMSKALAAYEESGDAGFDKYIASLPSNVNTDAIIDYVATYGQLPLEQRTYTKTKDTVNGLWGIDGNDVVKDQYGNSYRVDELPKSIQKQVTQLKKGQTYTGK